MRQIEWNDSFRVGIAEFDKHHKHLFEILAEFFDDFSMGVSKFKLGLVLDKLIDYATYHFTCEEQYMRDSSYPAFAEHEKEHQRFIQEVTEIQENFHRHNVGISQDILTFLAGWISNHVLGTDAEYARYFAANAVAE